MALRCSSSFVSCGDVQCCDEHGGVQGVWPTNASSSNALARRTPDTSAVLDWVIWRAGRAHLRLLNWLRAVPQLFLRGLTFELSGRQRQDASARTAKMYRVPPAGPAWHGVGARLERGVRPR